MHVSPSSVEFGFLCRHALSKSSVVEMGTWDEQHNQCATGAGRMSALQRSLNNACSVCTWEERLLHQKREVSLLHPTEGENSVV